MVHCPQAHFYVPPWTVFIGYNNTSGTIVPRISKIRSKKPLLQGVYISYCRCLVNNCLCTDLVHKQTKWLEQFKGGEVHLRMCAHYEHSWTKWIWFLQGYKTELKIYFSAVCGPSSYKNDVRSNGILKGKHRALIKKLQRKISWYGVCNLHLLTVHWNPSSHFPPSISPQTAPKIDKKLSSAYMWGTG